MYNDYDYPLGADNSSAPWNEVDNPEIERDCEVTETIARKVTLSTTDYVAEEDWDDDFGKCVSADTSDTDWAKEYSNQEYTALELIAKLKTYVEEDIKNTSLNTSKGRELQRLLSACDGWEQVELEVEEV
ncbi:hypothetical protein [Prevotella sp. KH2C16]|uniref:hypothetical protein n=1 Tax=Prevotella sp. KH2C16 TaxID=1855325 RepID=UPI0008E10648|nr:hypothetical protein [Prevotella sp. KH2C16]SFG55471.1 hypothetical protein SAMN05216383_12025 [Prevotella sp. KH2C16]